MLSERKILWLTWYVRFVALFGTLCLLFAAYIRTFVNPDVMDSYVFIAVALTSGMLFFTTFPGHRVRVRVIKLKEQLSEKFYFDNTLQAEASLKSEGGLFIKFTIVFIITLAVMILNFVLGRIANLNGDNSILFIHMVFVVGTAFVFNAVILIYIIDDTFSQLRDFISKLPKGQIAEEKSE
jgi:hypothetical protein